MLYFWKKNNPYWDLGNMKRLILIVLVALSFSSCEKDDICDSGTSTTPRLIIDFYDNTASTPTLKAVSNLGIVAPGFTTGYSFNGVSRIQVPLDPSPNVNSVTWQFIQNGADSDSTNDNIDLITFDYTTNYVYVSRACGYKSQYTLDNSTPYILTDGSTADGLWIQNVTVAKYNVATENEVHLKIYF